ncbi:hypothetical protein AOLI_G00137780 [Acnodon oligacanthus]
MVVKLLCDTDLDINAGIVRRGRKRVFLPAKQVSTVYIRAHIGYQYRGQELLFSSDELNPVQEDLVFKEVLVRVPDTRVTYVPIPVANTTKQNVFLEPHMILGYLQPVKCSYTPAAQPENHTEKADTREPNTNVKETIQPCDWDPPVSLDHLTETEQQAVRKMLREECHAFSFDDDDTGCIPSLKMHVMLHDPSPVQKTFISVPKPLHEEVKEAPVGTFNFTIRYHLGKSNVDGDGLSRMPLSIHDYMEKFSEVVGQDVISATVKSVAVERGCPSQGMGTVRINALDLLKEESSSRIGQPFTPYQIQAAQKNDCILSRVLQYK